MLILFVSRDKGLVYAKMNNLNEIRVLNSHGEIKSHHGPNFAISKYMLLKNKLIKKKRCMVNDFTVLANVRENGLLKLLSRSAVLHS